MRFAECEPLGGRWHLLENCDEGYECPAFDPCGWDNGIVPNGVTGRGVSPPRFPNTRVADDVFAEADCVITEFRANVIEDDNWFDGGQIEVTVYADTGSGPGAIRESATTGFTRTATGDVYSGRKNYDYIVEGLAIEVEAGGYWIGFRNPAATGSGTNWWETSDGGVDGPSSDTGWVSVNGGNVWSPLGDQWHLAFEVNGVESLGACCLPGRACPDREPEWVCDGDVDGDGQVNPVDSGLVQASFGSDDERELCQYDLDCDGQINPVDAGLVQSLFGTCDAPRPPCFAEEHCAVLAESECRAREGLFLGGGTGCEGDPCGG